MTVEHSGSATATAVMPLGVHALSVHYRRGRRVALRSVDWQLQSGERVILLGPNGAGKSTLLGVLAGSLKATDGHVHAGGRDASRSVLRENVARMPQTVTAVPRLTCLEQVAYAGWLGGLPERLARERAAGALGRVALKDRATDRADTLSGGQLRRLGLAETLVRQTPVVLLDEPTAGLDPHERARFREVLRAVGDVAFVVATHETHDISEVFDRVTVLNAGSIIFDGSVLGLLGETKTATVEAAYIELMDRAPV